MSRPFPYSVGVGVFVRRNSSEILVGRRTKQCARGAGCLALPGGHVEAGETIVQAALREVEEETGLAVQLYGARASFRVSGLLAVTDHFDIEQQRDGRLLDHLTMWIMTHHAGGEPVNREPHKCAEWLWMPPHKVLETPGAENPTHEQYYWTPAPLWREILQPYFGRV
jgi:8-oxo-dGTP diphosphatase